MEKPWIQMDTVMNICGNTLTHLAAHPVWHRGNAGFSARCEESASFEGLLKADLFLGRRSFRWENRRIKKVPVRLFWGTLLSCEMCIKPGIFLFEDRSFVLG